MLSKSMKCDTCVYGGRYELEKPCIVYREDCRYYKGETMTRIKVYCEKTECKNNECGECVRQSEYVNLDHNAECEDYEESEDE